MPFVGPFGTSVSITFTQSLGFVKFMYKTGGEAAKPSAVVLLMPVVGYSGTSVSTMCMQSLGLTDLIHKTCGAAVCRLVQDARACSRARLSYPDVKTPCTVSAASCLGGGIFIIKMGWYLFGHTSPCWLCECFCQQICLLNISARRLMNTLSLSQIPSA